MPGTVRTCAWASQKMKPKAAAARALRIRCRVTSMGAPGCKTAILPAYSSRRTDGHDPRRRAGAPHPPCGGIAHGAEDLVPGAAPLRPDGPGGEFHSGPAHFRPGSRARDERLPA